MSTLEATPSFPVTLTEPVPTASMAQPSTASPTATPSLPGGIPGFLFVILCLVGILFACSFVYAIFCGRCYRLRGHFVERWVSRDKTSLEEGQAKIEGEPSLSSNPAQTTSSESRWLRLSSKPLLAAPSIHPATQSSSPRWWPGAPTRLLDRLHQDWRHHHQRRTSTRISDYFDRGQISASRSVMTGIQPTPNTTLTTNMPRCPLSSIEPPGLPTRHCETLRQPSSLKSPGPFPTHAFTFSSPSLPSPAHSASQPSRFTLTNSSGVISKGVIPNNGTLKGGIPKSPTTMLSSSGPLPLPGTPLLPHPDLPATIILPG